MRRSTPRRRMRRVAAGVAVLLLVGACGRGVPEVRVSSRGPHPGDVAGRPPVTSPTKTPASNASSTTEPAAPLTTATTGPPPMSSAPGGPTPATTTAPAVGHLSSDGALSEFPLPTVQANPMGVPDMGSSPSAIIPGPDGAMWFVEMGADQIGRITLEGLITEYPLPSRSRVHANPEGITAGPDGAVWFTEALTYRLGRIDPATGAITEFTTFPSAQRGISASVATAVDGALWSDDINAPLTGR